MQPNAAAVVLVTGAAAGSAARSRSSWPRTAATWRCTTARRPPKPRDGGRRCARSARTREALRRRPGRRGAVPRAAARGACSAWGRLDAVVNNASLFEYDDVGQLQLRGDGRALAQPTPRRRSCWRRRCTRTSTGAAGRRRAAWSTCSTRSCGTRTPTTCRTRCPRPRCEAATHAAGAGAGAARCACAASRRA